MPVVGGVKGTKMRLLLEVPPLIFNVYQRRRFVCFVCVRWGVKGNLKLLRLSLNVPPPIRLRVSTSYFRGGANECKSTLFVSLRWKTYGMYWLCMLSLKIHSGIAPECQTVLI